MKYQRHPSIIIACIILAEFLFRLPASAQVDLSILNAAGTSSTILVNPGQSFKAQVYVTGLTSGNPLDSFDLTFVLPTGVTLTGFTDTVPAGWIPLSNVPQLQYGAANFSGSDISGSTELVLASFQTSANISPGFHTLTLTPPGPLQDLTGASGAISYSLFSASVDVTAIPEPSTLASFLAGATFLTAFALRRRIRTALPFPSSDNNKS